MGAKKKIDTLQPPSIYGYHDYRKFLKDWLSYKKLSQSNFSLRSIAKTAGVATGYINMILSGSRNLSKKGLTKLSPHLGLSKTELSFLNQLRIVSDSELQFERLQALKKIQRFQGYKQINKNEVETYKYLTKWYHVAIREMTALTDFQLNPFLDSKTFKNKIIH